MNICILIAPPPTKIYKDEIRDGHEAIQPALLKFICGEPQVPGVPFRTSQLAATLTCQGAAWVLLVEQLASRSRSRSRNSLPYLFQMPPIQTRRQGRDWSICEQNVRLDGSLFWSNFSYILILVFFALGFHYFTSLHQWVQKQESKAGSEILGLCISYANWNPIRVKSHQP